MEHYEIDPESHGYKVIPCTSFRDAEKCWQKRFRDSNGITLYFIEIYLYRHNFLGEIHYTYEAECQLYNKGNHNPVNLNLFSGWTIEEIEDKVEKIYNTCDFEPYDECTDSY